MSEAAQPRHARGVHPGLFFVTLATLMFEILLTRILSVTTCYHLAFLAISVATFGIPAGAVIVYLRPGTFTEARAPAQLAAHSLWFALTLVGSFLVCARLPLRGILNLALTCTVIAVPLVHSGIVAAVALTKARAPLHGLYAAHLLGAAFGGLLLVGTLAITDAASAVLVVGTLAALGAIFFSLDTEGSVRRAVPWVAFFALGVAAAGHTELAAENRPFLDIVDAAEQRTGSYRWVRWNSYSRVTVSGEADVLQSVPGRGLSEKSGARAAKVHQLALTIDNQAGMTITAFDGDTRPLAFLKDDVTNLAHYLRRDGDVMVVGVGGGQDVLSALVFGQKSVTGVEVNKDVFAATTDVFAKLAGELQSRRTVSLLVDDARSFVARTRRQFDIIHLPLIHTWAATAAGPFVFTENSLYTLEAWMSFLEHLKPRGVLTVSRWYHPPLPGEALRIASLAGEALRGCGVQEPRKHVIMIKAKAASELSDRDDSGVITILVSPDPFTAADLATLRSECDRLGFQILISPEIVARAAYAALLGSNRPDAFYESFPLDVSAPTDDRPFFFQMLRLKHVWRSLADSARDPNRPNLEAVRSVVVLLAIAAGLVVLCIVAPLAINRRLVAPKEALSHLAFFAAIGLGFMLVEVSQMQRLLVLLGQPDYALTVVLPTLFVGTAAGSLASGRLVGRGALSPLRALLALLVVLVILGLLTPSIAARLAAATTPARLAAAAAVLVASGFFMGIPIPLGMRAAASRVPQVLPWLWGINGAASVLGSVLAVVVALSAGVTMSFWAGVGCYLIAAVAHLFAAEAPVGTVR